MRHNRDIMPVDWAVLKADYLIHYELSLAALAENYGIDYTHLCEVAAREHWQQEREIRSFRIQKDALDRSAHDQVAKLADFDSECLRQAKAILANGEHCLGRASQAARHPLAGGGGGISTADWQTMSGRCHRNYTPDTVCL